MDSWPCQLKVVTDAQWKIRNSEAGLYGRGKLSTEVQGKLEWEVGRWLTACSTNRVQQEAARLPSGWELGAGLAKGRGKDGVRGGGCRRRLSGCCSMAEKPPVLWPPGPPSCCGGVSCRRGWSLCFSGFGGWKMLQRDEAAAEEVAAAESATALGWREGGSGGGGGVRGPTV